MASEPTTEGSVSPGLGRIYLVGFMAAGKTTVGAALAEILGGRFMDLDREIEAIAGERVHRIFERHGETHFRRLEHRCLERTADVADAVIATGGGTMAFERNREAIRHLGVSVWLDPGFETLLDRLTRSTRSRRPMFEDEEQARALYHRRLDAYRMADLRIEIPPDGTVRSVAASIALLLRERSCVI